MNENMTTDKKVNIRELAMEVLLEAEKNDIFIKEALNRQLFAHQFMSKQERAFLSRLVEGVTEYKIQLDYIVNCYSKTKINKCKPLIRVLLRMGVYQIFYMDSVPDGAAVNECVKLARKRGFANLSGFVNGVLRQITRSKDNIEFPDADQDQILHLSVKYSMPAWIVERYISWFGTEKAGRVLAASLEEKDITIRVNGNRITKNELARKLEDYGVKVSPGAYVVDALHLKDINYVGRLPGFNEGEFFVQDESSMLLYYISGAEEMLKGREHEPLKILDLCAAPGGKCTHFGEKLGENAIIEARDISENKIDKINENINRLKLDNIKTALYDALVPDETKRNYADIVIADLPCSGLGVLSGKNDVKYHIKRQQLLELTNLQRNILSNAAEYVKPGGVLLYSTCTINPSENEDNSRWFLAHFPFEGENITSYIPEELHQYMESPFSLSLIPGYVKCDGFYIAKFRKRG